MQSICREMFMGFVDAYQIFGGICVGFVDAYQALVSWQRLLPKSGKALLAFVKPESSFLYLESRLEKVYLKSGLE